MTSFSRVYRWALPGLALALPLFFGLNLNDAFDLPKMSLVYAAVALLLPWRLWEFKKNPHVLFVTGAECAALFFLAAAALSTYASIDPATSLSGLYRVHVFGFLPMLAFLFLFWLAAQEDCLHRLALAVMIGGAVAGYYGLFQYSGVEFFQAMPHIEGGRPWSSLGNPIFLGAVCMMALVLTLGEWPQKRYDRWLLSALMAGQGAGLLLSLSRSAWVGTLAGILFLGILQRRKTFLGVMGLVIVMSILILPSVRQRAGILFSRSEGSNASRLEGWRGAVAVWRDHPLLGSGPDTFFEAFRPHRSLAYIRATGAEVTQAHAHNDLLQMAATLGTLGIFCFLGLLIVLSVRTLSICRANPQGSAVPLAAACFALLIQNQFNFSSVATTAWAALLLGQILRRPGGFTRLGGRAREFIFGGALAASALLVMIVSRSWIADLADKRGQGLIQGAQPVLALVAFRDSVRFRPDVEAYQTDLGNAAKTLAQLASPGSVRTELFKEAQMSAQANTQRHPRDPDAWNNQGVVAMWRNQLNQEATMPDAQRAFQRAVDLDPYFVDGWANLAKWHHLQGDIPGEKQLWRKVLEIDPQHAMARTVLAQ